MKVQYAILRFAKYKGPEIGHIESHNERTKEKYASNPDVDTSRSHLNFHLVTPQRKYRAEAEKQIAEAGCRTRSDSVRVVEALVTSSPEFFKGKKKSEVKAYFQEALDFIREHQDPKNIISAVVHMDEKTPHMHLCFVPLTEDGRLSAKEIVGNKKKLTQWQDRFWEHMVKKYPDLERGESASETGRDHRFDTPNPPAESPRTRPASAGSARHPYILWGRMYRPWVCHRFGGILTASACIRPLFFGICRLYTIFCRKVNAFLGEDILPPARNRCMQKTFDLCSAK